MRKATVTYTSILKGRASRRFGASDGQFEASSGIDPDLVISGDTLALGAATPCAMTKFSGSNVNDKVIAIVNCPQNTNTYVVLANGRLVRYNSSLASETLIGTVAGDNAEGATYYNNYIYIFGTGKGKDDVSRYGPLDNIPSLVDGIWAGGSLTMTTGIASFTIGLKVTGGTSGATGYIIGKTTGPDTLILSGVEGTFVAETVTDSGSGTGSTLGAFTDSILGSQTKLNDTTYPYVRNSIIPNHWGWVHSDNSLYFCDFANGQGLIHRIHTMKSTYEGEIDDTDVPSAYNVLDLPFGFYPTSIASYSTSVSITAVQTINYQINQGPAALFIWNPTNTVTFDQMITLPDSLATAMMVRNGELHVFTGSALKGCRISTYSGGDTVQEATYIADGTPPRQGAVDIEGRRLLFGSYCLTPQESSAVYALGSESSQSNYDLQNIISVGSLLASQTQCVTAIKSITRQNSSQSNPDIIVSAYNDTDGNGLYKRGATVQGKLSLPTAIIGRKFKIDEIHVPLGSAVASGTSIQPLISYDLGDATESLTAISNTNYPSAKKVTYVNGEMPKTGDNSFRIDFTWSGTIATPIAFPITVKLTIYDD